MIGQIVRINGKKYLFKAVLQHTQKYPNEDLMGVTLGIQLFDKETGREVPYSDYKKTYIQEKISDFVQNSVNGQNTFYWDWSKC